MKIFQSIFVILAVFISVVTATQAFAVDYDYESAHRRWQSEKAQLDAAEAELQRQLANLAPLQRAYDAATAEVNRLTGLLRDNRDGQRAAQRDLDSARSQLQNLLAEQTRLAQQRSNLERDVRDFQNQLRELREQLSEQQQELRDIEARIRELERGGSDGPWTCVYVDSGWEEHSGGHSATNADKETAKAEANAACLAVHGSCSLSACTQPDSPELAQLRRQRDALANRIQQTQNEINTCSNELDEAQRRLSDINRAIQQNDSNISQCRNEIRSLENRLADLRDREDDLAFDLRAAETRANDARSARDRAQLAVDRAQEVRDSERREERAAWAYYEQVKDNYDRAYAAAVAKGRSDADSHGTREARDRAAGVGNEVGRRDGTEAGRSRGLQDAREVSQVRGYNRGLREATSDGRLAESYAAGIASGESTANQKARGEDFPRGYNDRLFALLSDAPANSQTHDISVELPDLPGEVGPILSAEQKAQTPVADPRFGEIAEPGLNIPTPSNNPSFTVPATDRRYYNADCASQPLPVFSQACTQAYSETYDPSYRGGYRTIYVGEYRSGFVAVAEGEYRRARDTSFPELELPAAKNGARDKGILVGFAGRLPSAREQEYQNGTAELNRYRTTGFLPLLRSVVLEQSVDDGVYSPGESLNVVVTIDNYGTKFAARESLRIRLADVTGGTFTATIRDLPALEGDTRVILRGVVVGQVSGAAGANLGLNAVLEHEQTNGEYITIDEAQFSNGIRLPVELVAIEFPAPLDIGVASRSVVKLRNNTTRDLADLDFAFSILGEGLTSTLTTIDLDSVAAGATAAVEVPVTADEYAGGNSPLAFKLDATSIAGSGPISVTKTVAVPVNRAGQLDLCLPRCGETLNFPLRVRAGATIAFTTQFSFRGTRRLMFEFGKLAVSDNRITSGNGSTVRVGPSEWGPGSQPYQANFTYVFPVALRGQQHWVSLYLKQGSQRIQVLKLPVQVE